MKTINYLLFAFLALAVFSCKKDPVKPITAAFTLSDAPYYVGNEIIFSNKSENATSYNWDFGDGMTSKDKDPRHTYTKVGSYTIQLTAIEGDSSKVATQNIEVLNPDPTLKAAFSVPSGKLYHKKLITFTNNSTGASSYFWEFGDGKTSAEKSPKHDFAKTGDYKVTLTALDTEGNKSEATKVLKIEKNPEQLIPDFTWNGKFYQKNINFINSSKGAESFEWSFGDGAKSTAVSPTHIYKKPGKYDVTLKVSDGTNSKTIKKSIDVEIKWVDVHLGATDIRMRTTTGGRSRIYGYMSMSVEEKAEAGGWVRVNNQENIWSEDGGSVADPKGLQQDLPSNQTFYWNLNGFYRPIKLDEYKVIKGLYRAQYRFKMSVWHQDIGPFGVPGSVGHNPMLNEGSGYAYFNKLDQRQKFESEEYKTDGNRPYYLAGFFTVQVFK